MSNYFGEAGGKMKKLEAALKFQFVNLQNLKCRIEQSSRHAQLLRLHSRTF